MSTHDDSPASTRGNSVTRNIVATGVGNFMEWFDFAVYGFFAIAIGKTFFPSESPTVSLLSTLAVYGVAFLMRPLGGVFFGSIGDRVGRRRSLALAVIMMGLATTAIALLPSYETIGLISPILLVVFRCVQGFSAGGEWTGSAAFIVENTSSRRRGLAAAVVPGTAALAVACGALSALCMEMAIGTAAVEAWGWRVPFLAAFPLTIAGLYIRLRLDDTLVYQQLQKTGTITRKPLRNLGRVGFKPIAIAFALSSITVLGFYYLAAYVVTFLTVTVSMDRSEALVVIAFGALLYAAMCPAAGLIADRVGRRPVSLAGAAGLAIATIPAFLLMLTGDPILAVAGIALFGIFEALHNVSTTVMLIELFPAHTRATSSAIGYNLGAAVIAGPGPLIAAALAAAAPNTVLPTAYMIAVATIAGLVLWRWLPETRWRSIGADAELDAHNSGALSAHA